MQCDKEFCTPGALKGLGRNDSVHVPLHYQVPQSILFEDAIRTDVNEQAVTCNDGDWAMGEL